VKSQEISNFKQGTISLSQAGGKSCLLRVFLTIMRLKCIFEDNNLNGYNILGFDYYIRDCHVGIVGV